MIVKTLYIKRPATGWLGYIKYHSLKSELLEKKYKGLFNSLGRRATADEIRQFVNMSEDTMLTRMFIFAPARYIHPIFLSEYTAQVIREYIRQDNRTSIRFMYALHYNTDHPHSHVVMTAYYPEDLLFKKRENYLMRNIAVKVFKEPIGVPPKVVEKVKKTGDERKMQRIKIIMKVTEEIESHLQNEEKDMRKFKVRSVDDVINMDLGR